MCKRRSFTRGNRKFFRIALSNDNITNYYKTNFALMQHHKYSLTELENLMPWERDIYIQLLTEHLEEERNRQNAQQASMPKG